MTLDRLALDRASARSIDEDGHLHVSLSNISKAAVNPYYGREIPNADAMGLDADRVYMLLRDPDEMAAAVATFEGKPLMVVHRPQVATDHDALVVVGSVNDVRWSRPYWQATLHAWVQDAIDDIQSGKKREISSSYRYDADMTPGVYEGTPYDGVMRNLRGNHVALVEAGRAGPDVIVGDSQLKPSKKDMRMPKANASLSQKASVAEAALHIYLKPRLAQDAKIDLAPMLKGLTSKNWETRKGALVADITKAAKTKMAADVDLDDISEVIDMLDGVLPDLEDVVDEAKEDEDDLDENGNKKVPAAEDEDKDDKYDDDKKKKGDKAKPAMDAATVQRMIMDATTKQRADFRDMRLAEEFVRPYVGPIAIAQDSAASVYKLALDTLGVKVAGVHPSAYRAILEAQQKPDASRPVIAQDSAASRSEFEKMFPKAGKMVRS